MCCFVITYATTRPHMAIGLVLSARARWRPYGFTAHSTCSSNCSRDTFRIQYCARQRWRLEERFAKRYPKEHTRSTEKTSMYPHTPNHVWSYDHTLASLQWQCRLWNQMKSTLPNYVSESLRCCGSDCGTPIYVTTNLDKCNASATRTTVSLVSKNIPRVASIANCATVALRIANTQIVGEPKP